LAYSDPDGKFDELAAKSVSAASAVPAASVHLHGGSEVVVAQEVEKTIEFFEFVLEERATTVQIDGEAEVRATINIALFRRALSNLLQNAIEHSLPGSRLAVRIAKQGDTVWVSVSNPGEPVEAAHLPRLFDRFYRVDASRHDDGTFRGHGLGLAIAKAVANMHGGGVSAISVGGVTTVAFSVPRR
jgi:two-component system, OmpR family, heavy metal sensor histidine kinase CusS